MNSPTIIIAGQGRELATSLLTKVLDTVACRIMTTSEEAPEFRATPCQIVLLLPLLKGQERTLRRSLRSLTHRQGLVVAYSHDATIRIGCKGFDYRFRWFDAEHPWPGLSSNALAILGAARIAHELGVSQSQIKRLLT